MPEPFSDPEFHEAGEVRFRAPRRAGAVVGTAVAFAAAQAGPLGAAVVAIAGPLVILGALAGAAGEAQPIASVGVFVSLAGSVLLTSAVLAFVRLYQAEAPRGVADVWEEVKDLVGVVFRVTAYSLLAVLLLAIPLVIVLAMLWQISQPLAVVAGVAAGLALVFTAAPVLALAPAAAALDGLDVGAALRRAADLVRAEWGLTVGVTVMVGVLTVGVLAGAAAVLESTVGTEGAAAAVGGAVVSLVTMPVSAVLTLVWVTLYGSLVARVERPELSDEMDALEAGGRKNDRDRP